MIIWDNYRMPYSEARNGWGGGYGGDVGDGEGAGDNGTYLGNGRDACPPQGGGPRSPLYGINVENAPLKVVVALEIRLLREARLV